MKKNTTKKSTTATKKVATKKTTAKKTNRKATPVVADSQMYGKLRHLRPGHAVSSAKFGTVKCTAAGKDTKSGRKAFSISQSKVATNRGGYTFGEVVKAFGLKK